MKTTLLLSLLFTLAVAGSTLQAADVPQAGAAPVLVELFTSEGCSSCPPADALLQKLDRAQPVAGAELIVLSEHVDYWNHLGWSDPYSSPFFSERQSAYAHSFNLETVYTPQIIVDGTTDLRIGNPEKVRQTLERAAATPKIALRLGQIQPQAGAQVLQIHLDADAATVFHGGDVFAAVAFNQAQSQVLRGENGGRHLTHVAVVQSLRKIGHLQKGKAFTCDARLEIKPGTDPGNIRVIVFVQESGPGKVVGAAIRKAGE
jgi:hypothetical protein